MILHFDVGRDMSIKALEEAMINDQLIFLVTQKDAKVDFPDIEDVYKVGTISKVKQLLKLPGDTIRVLVEGISRAEIAEFTQEEPFFIAEVVEKSLLVDDEKKAKIEALRRRVLDAFEEYAKHFNTSNNSFSWFIHQTDNLNFIANFNLPSFNSTSSNCTTTCN
jgi:ATP-dependent Lon protease